MEEGKQESSKTEDIADESGENRAGDRSTNSEATDGKNSGEAGPSSENISSNVETGAAKPPSQRNYRRRTGQSDDDSTDVEEPEHIPEAENVGENPPPATASDSEDVSLDELQVGENDEGHVSSR